MRDWFFVCALGSTKTYSRLLIHTRQVLTHSGFFVQSKINIIQWCIWQHKSLHILHTSIHAKYCIIFSQVFEFVLATCSVKSAKFNVPQILQLLQKSCHARDHERVNNTIWGAFHQAFCQCFSPRMGLTTVISYWNPCIWLAESKFVSEKHWQNAWWNAPQAIAIVLFYVWIQYERMNHNMNCTRVCANGQS